MSVAPDPLDNAIGRLMRLAQAADPQLIVESVSMTVAEIGGGQVALYLVDVDHTRLRAHPHSVLAGRPERVSVSGSVPGRVLTSGLPIAAHQDDGSWHVWVPVVERSEQLGVLAMTLPEWDTAVESFCVELGIAAAHIVRTATSYTDSLARLRRSRHMALAAEMQWSLLPPLACTVETTTVAGLLEPAYDVGGDCFDYALNGDVLDLAVFDSVGHGVRSSELAFLTVSAYRNERRTHAGTSLIALADAVDRAVRQQAGDEEFIAAMLARLDITDGHFEWISAGHPTPLLLRRAQVVDLPPTPAAPPLGLVVDDLELPVVMASALEPGDTIVLYTDGVVDAEDVDGTPFGEARLRDVVAREEASGRSPADTLAHLVVAVLAHAGGRLRDDASLLYLRWDGPAPSRRG